MAGKLVIFSGPSGAGKSTLVKHLRSIDDFALDFSISATSRAKREGEVEGKDYYFLSIDEFKSRIENNDFIEWEEVYTGQYYGSLKSEISRLSIAGRNIIFDVDVVGGNNIRRANKDNSIAIFIKPPSIEVLEERLNNRKTDSEESKKKRLKKAKLEMTYARRFDHTIINDDLNQAKKEAEEIIRNFLTQ
jgi:guanylate kinase